MSNSKSHIAAFETDFLPMETSSTLVDRRPLVISGPSGVGKETLIDRLRANYPGTFVTTVSHTTRRPRAGEEEGQAYYFVSESDFQSLISHDAFVEWAMFSGNYYGTSKATIISQAADHQVVILDVDVQGAKSLRAEPNIDARYVFVEPHSLEALEARLRNRGTEEEESVRRRLDQARHELAEAHRGEVYDKFIINDDLETAFTKLVNFVFG